MDPVFWIVMALAFIFFAYLFYTGQFRWLFGVARNMVLGVAGILGVNAVLGLAGAQLYVGVNLVTAAVVGLLGVPGFLLLFGARLLVGR